MAGSLDCSPCTTPGARYGSDNLAEEVVDQASGVTPNVEPDRFSVVDTNADGVISEQELATHIHDVEPSAGPYRIEYYMGCSDLNNDHQLTRNETDKMNDAQRSSCYETFESFRQADMNGDVSLDRHEVEVIDEGAFGVQAEEGHFDWTTLFVCADQNANGKIEPWEFVSKEMTSCYRRKINQARGAFFRRIDSAPRDNCVTKDELATALQEYYLFNVPKNTSGVSWGAYHLEWTPEMTVYSDRMYDCLDVKKTGNCLTKREYVAIMKPRKPDPFNCLVEADRQYSSDVVFALMDENGDHRVTKSEFFHWVDEHKSFDIQYGEVEAMFENTDTNNDGFVDHSEFDKAGENHAGDGQNAFFFHTNASNASSTAGNTSSSMASLLPRWRIDSNFTARGMPFV